MKIFFSFFCLFLVVFSLLGVCGEDQTSFVFGRPTLVVVGNNDEKNGKQELDEFLLPSQLSREEKEQIDLGLKLSRSSVSRRLEFNDPIFPLQWHLQSDQELGLHLEELQRNNATGQGVNIGVCVAAADQTNQDLKENLSRNSLLGDNSHYRKYVATGTAVASLLLAKANNRYCSVGVANEANLVLLEVEHFSSPGSASTTLYAKSEIVDIYLYTFGVNTFDSRDLLILPDKVKLGLHRHIHTGRNGKGIIAVGTVRDDRDELGNCNIDELTTRRDVISVSQVTRDGKPGTAPVCSNYLVTAPTGLQTTYDRECSTDVTLQGNQASSPIVAGVVALLLQKQPNLMWYDVQFILLASAKVIEQPGGGSWQKNGAGRLVSHDFGYGLVNPIKALWMLDYRMPGRVSARQSRGFSSTTRQPIPDCQGSKIVTFQVPPDRGTSKLTLQHVEVSVNINHHFPGDLEIFLTSPSGTRATLMTPRSSKFTRGTRLTQQRIEFIFQIGETLVLDAQYSHLPEEVMELEGVTFVTTSSKCCPLYECDIPIFSKTAVIIEPSELCDMNHQIITIMNSFPRKSRLAMIIFPRVNNHHQYRNLSNTYSFPILSFNMDIYRLSLENLAETQQAHAVKITPEAKFPKKDSNLAKLNWTMASTFFWDEPAEGQWDLSFSDLFCEHEGTITYSYLQLIFGSPMEILPSPSPTPFFPSPSPTPTPTPFPFPSPSPPPIPSPINPASIPNFVSRF